MDYNKKIQEIEVRLRLTKYRQRLTEDKNRGDVAYTTILSRQPPEDYLHEWQEKLRISSAETTEGKQISMLAFKIGSDIFGCDIIHIKDISLPKPVHRIPLYAGKFAGRLIEGSVNFKGRIQTVFSLASFLNGVQEKKWSSSFDIASRSSCRMILIQSGRREVVFLVDELLGIFEYESQQKKELPLHVARDPQHILSGMISWGEHQDVGLIDVERLVLRLGG